MKVELTDVSETKKTLTVEVPQEVVEAEVARITQRYARLPPREGSGTGRPEAVPRGNPS